jgi:hypothetical protein
MLFSRTQRGRMKRKKRGESGRRQENRTGGGGSSLSMHKYKNS